MHSVTFVGEVHQGQLHISQPLGEFEGKQVLVTLIAPDAALSPRPESGAVSKPVAALEAELLEDSGRVAVTPRARQVVAAQVIAVARRPPRLGFEEE
jgi:hypothetical protein